MSIHAQRGSFGGPIQELNAGNKKASLDTINELSSFNEHSLHVQDVSILMTPMMKSQASTVSVINAGPNSKFPDGMIKEETSPPSHRLI